jgi:hypothetical protein
VQSGEQAAHLALDVATANAAQTLIGLAEAACAIIWAKVRWPDSLRTRHHSRSSPEFESERSRNTYVPWTRCARETTNDRGRRYTRPSLGLMRNLQTRSRFTIRLSQSPL